MCRYIKASVLGRKRLVQERSQEAFLSLKQGRKGMQGLVQTQLSVS